MDALPYWPSSHSRPTVCTLKQSSAIGQLPQERLTSVQSLSSNAPRIMEKARDRRLVDDTRRVYLYDRDSVCQSSRHESEQLPSSWTV